MTLRAFMLQEPLLSPQPACIACESTLSANHTVAWDQEGEGVSANRRRHGAHSTRLADLRGQRPVATGGACWQSQERLPDPPLQWRALAEVQRWQVR